MVPAAARCYGGCTTGAANAPGCDGLPSEKLPSLFFFFADPRYGNLGFLPKKRCRRGRGRVKSFPKDDASKKPHLTAFMGFKAGMTHIVRDLDKPGSKAHKKEVRAPPCWQGVRWLALHPTVPPCGPGRSFRTSHVGTISGGWWSLPTCLLLCRNHSPCLGSVHNLSLST